MTKIEEMWVAFRKAEIDCTGPRDWVTKQGLIAALKVLREANTAMKTAGVVSKDRYGSVADIFESMIDAVLDAHVEEAERLAKALPKEPPC